MKAIGIILAGGNNRMRMGGLSTNRAIAAMPVACTYRSIDFALSNMTNSGIGKVAVLTMYNAKSINEYLRSSKWWNFGRKNGGLYVFAPTLTSRNSWWYRGTADSIYQNIEWLKSSHEPYVVVASGDGIYKLDYSKVIDYHIEKEADITIVCTHVNDDPRRYGVISIDEENRITELQEKPLEPDSNLISCGIYIFRRRMLIEMLEQCAAEDKSDLVNDIILRYIKRNKVFAYLHNDFWSSISSTEKYYKTNMAFLDTEVRKYFFEEEPRIYTKIGDRPPAKFNENTDVRNSLVAAGCIVNGTVHDSLLFKSAYVGNRSVVKDSIIMNDVYIQDDVYLENCIIESHSVIKSGSSYIGEEQIKVINEGKDIYEFT
ncbi:MAG: glucose-1-phosphate adenylyltransferase subunit GlgD [Firmicutes bacterium]|nr:glucose-1-phosphate adenylyltransferase subunit GlgD [Bacillota bacterium]